MWCETRLLSSGGQFDQTSNMLAGAVPAQDIYARRETFLSLQLCDGQVQGVCVSMRAFAFMCVYVFVCVYNSVPCLLR